MAGTMKSCQKSPIVISISNVHYNTTLYMFFSPHTSAVLQLPHCLRACVSWSGAIFMDSCSTFISVMKFQRYTV